MRHIYKYIILAVSIVFLSSCIYKYEAEGGEGGGVIVIEGDIVIGDKSELTISESLPRNSIESVKSLTANYVVIECEDGTIYNSVYLEEENTNYVGRKKGYYSVDTKNLDPSKRYKLVVKMTRLRDGKSVDKTYTTDFLDVYMTPPIDSVNYTIDENKTVKVMVNTHSDDPNIKNYKWSYLEDWEVRAHIYSEYLYDPDSNQVVRMKNFSEQNTYYCWQRHYSTEIIVGNSDQLSENVISGQKVTFIPNTNYRLSSLYAIEVYQQAISDASYKYWQNVFKNNEEIGGIFSPQPNEMRGNIYCVEDLSENVLGYVDAGVVQKKRMWIDARKLGIYDRGKHTCLPIIENDPANWLWMYRIGNVVAEYDMMSGNYTWYQRSCVDCRLTGTKNRPDYFPAY